MLRGASLTLPRTGQPACTLSSQGSGPVRSGPAKGGSNPSKKEVPFFFESFTLRSYWSSQHDMSFLHRSDTNRLAERSVRKRTKALRLCQLFKNSMKMIVRSDGTFSSFTTPSTFELMTKKYDTPLSGPRTFFGSVVFQNTFSTKIKIKPHHRRKELSTSEKHVKRFEKKNKEFESRMTIHIAKC